MNEVTRRSATQHDCIRGNEPRTIQRVVKALGPDAVPVYAEVLQKCPVIKDDYPVYACFALDALGAEGGKASVAAMEKELSNKDKVRKNVYLGALFRLMNTKGWKTNGQLAQMIPTEAYWEAKDLVIEHIRHHKDPSAKPDLEKAYAAEPEQQEKGLIKAALLEIDNPGKCVVNDEGRAASGTCRYTGGRSSGDHRAGRPAGADQLRQRGGGYRGDREAISSGAGCALPSSGTSST